MSVAGRINSIKMTVLLKFTYLFQSIPVFFLKSFFSEDGWDYFIINLELQTCQCKEKSLNTTQMFRWNGSSRFPTYYWPVTYDPYCTGYMRTLGQMHLLGSPWRVIHATNLHWQHSYIRLLPYHIWPTQQTC